MNTKQKYNRVFRHGLLMLMACLAWSSCSEEIVDNGAGKAESETYSVTFHINGLEGQARTRSEGIVDVDFTKYVAKLYLFARENGTTDTKPENPFKGFKFIGNPEEGGDKNNPIEIADNGYVTVSNLQSTMSYIYAIVAYEKEYKENAEVKVLDKSGTFLTSVDLAENSLYTNCYIPALDENKYIPYDKAGEDYFMVYGAGGEVHTLLDSFTPAEIILTRQMGAVAFVSGETAKGDVECSVFSDYYRLYLSQMVEPNTHGTRNHCDDYAISNSYPIISQTFTEGNQLSDGSVEYVMYLPCTTTKQFGENIPKDEHANYDKAGDYGDECKTSITINDKTYSTTEPFPIYPNRRTVLTIGDGSTIRVTFGEENAIHQEGDWNGGL